MRKEGSYNAGPATLKGLFGEEKNILLAAYSPFCSRISLIFGIFVL
jgi:hypothetical protein